MKSSVYKLQYTQNDKKMDKMSIYMMVAFQRQEIYGRSFQVREIMHKKFIYSQHCLPKSPKRGIQLNTLSQACKT